MFYRPGALKQGLRGVSEGNVIIGYGMWLADQGIGIDVQFVTAPGVEFVVGVPSNVEVSSSHDIQLEFSFTSNFAAIVGNGTPVGGSLTAAITALVGDVGSLVLYIREVGGTTARATLACSVVPYTPKIAFAGNILRWRTASDLTESGAPDHLVSAIAEQVSVNAADIPVQATPAKQPVVIATDADFGGVPSVSFGATPLHTKGLKCAGSLALAQPVTHIFVHKWLAKQASGGEFLFDAAAATNRHYMRTDQDGGVGNYTPASATVKNSGVAVQTAQAECLYLYVSGAATSVELLLRDGTRVGPLTVAASTGTHAMLGTTIGSTYSVTTFGAADKFTDHIIVNGALTAPQKTAFEAGYLRDHMGWTLL